MYCTYYISSVVICVCTINKDYFYLLKRIKHSNKTQGHFVQTVQEKN